MKNNTEVVVKEFPDCDLCKLQGITEKAHFGGKTTNGQWGYMCEEHFEVEGIGLGKGQKLITKYDKENEAGLRRLDYIQERTQATQE